MGHLFSKPAKTKGDEVAYRKPTEASRKSISESIKSQSIKTDDGEIVSQKNSNFLFSCIKCCRRTFDESADSFLESGWDTILSTGPF